MTYFSSACNCFSHSELCTYNAAIGNSNGSLNAVGVYEGGGVCFNCQHNTTGMDCHQCMQAMSFLGFMVKPKPFR